MNSLQLIFVAMLSVSSSSMFDAALGEKTREKWELDEMDYEWEQIQEQVQKYTREQNEYTTSRDGWLEIYKRQQAKKQTREKSCHFPSLEEIKENILQSPHAKLFTEADGSGNVEVYDFKSPTHEGGCYNLKEKYREEIKSVDPEGNCVRLFSILGCRGWSQSIYPGSTIIPDAKLEGVNSIGPCVPNEFEHSAITKSSPPQLKKLPSALESFANVPDLIGDTWSRSETFTSVDPTSNPLYSYLLGPGNRVEALRGEIRGSHLKSGETAENGRVAGLGQSFYSKLELGKSDEPGYGIPLELGGPADAIYNVFPQNRKQAVNFKGKIVPWVKEWLTDNPSNVVYWNVNFVYKNPNTTRPSGIWYWGNQLKGKLMYGYVPNSE